MSSLMNMNHRKLFEKQESKNKVNIICNSTIKK